MKLNRMKRNVGNMFRILPRISSAITYQYSLSFVSPVYLQSKEKMERAM